MQKMNISKQQANTPPLSREPHLLNPVSCPSLLKIVDQLQVWKCHSPIGNAGSLLEFQSSASNQPTATPFNTSSVKKTYSPSIKARTWTADTASLEGVFAQHSQTPQATVSREDEFGEFHTGLAGSHSTTGQGTYDGHLTAASQRPEAATSISGLTSEGYSSTDTLQSRSHLSYPSQANSSPGQHRQNVVSSSSFSGLDASKFPAMYMEVYSRCAEGKEGYLSTELLFPMLLSSKLPTSVLRDLWTQANRATPGKLNQTELFVLLGLVGLVQVRNTGSCDVVSYMPRCNLISYSGTSMGLDKVP